MGGVPPYFLMHLRDQRTGRIDDRQVALGRPGRARSARRRARPAPPARRAALRRARGRTRHRVPRARRRRGRCAPPAGGRRPAHRTARSLARRCRSLARRPRRTSAARRGRRRGPQPPTPTAPRPVRRGATPATRHAAPRRSESHQRRVGGVDDARTTANGRAGTDVSELVRSPCRPRALRSPRVRLAPRRRQSRPTTRSDRHEYAARRGATHRPATARPGSDDRHVASPHLGGHDDVTRPHLQARDRRRRRAPRPARRRRIRDWRRRVRRATHAAAHHARAWPAGKDGRAAQCASAYRESDRRSAQSLVAPTYRPSATDREDQAVEVVVDEEVAGKPGPGEIRLVPASVVALVLDQPFDATPRRRRPGLAGRDQRKQRPRGLRAVSRCLGPIQAGSR